MRRCLSAVVAVLLTAGCGGSGGRRMNTSIERGPMPEGGTWAGVWFTNWGQMSITTQGSAAVGSFCDDDSNRYGRLEGTAQGNVFTFHWVTTDVTMAGSPRTTEGSGIAQFRFEASGDIQVARFDGSWGFGSSNADGGPLRGERSTLYSDRFLRGAYTIPCAIREVGEAPPPMSEDDVGDNPDLSEPLDGPADDSLF